MKLLESKPENKKRSPGGTIFSIVLHLTILFLAIFATARAGVRKAEKPRETKVSFVAVKKDEPPPPPKKEPPPPKQAPKPKAPTPKVVDLPKLPKEVAPAPPKGFKVLPPPVNIPTNLPTIDLSKAITNENDFSGKGVAGGSDKGVKGGTGKEGDTGKSAGVADHGPYMEFQVEKAVEKIGGDAPEYPASLRESGVEGQVLAQFVVNESGRYEGGSLKILSSSNPAFTAAVKDALPRMRFSAAQIGGKKVQQLVQMPFQFHLQK
ncbi:MAG: periplasmic protein TonB [Gemmatimonadaceae bacterium]|nr:periplasmic protein TonB [Gemmatimonadaceae bacterium]